MIERVDLGHCLRLCCPPESPFVTEFVHSVCVQEPTNMPRGEVPGRSRGVSRTEWSVRHGKEGEASAGGSPCTCWECVPYTTPGFLGSLLR